MSLADIELANLDIEPIFRNQALNSILTLSSFYKDVIPNIYLLDEKGNFKLQASNSNTAQLIQTIPSDTSTFIILHSQEEYSSYLIQNAENKGLFSSLESLPERSLISPISYQGGLFGILFTLIPDGTEVSDEMKVTFNRIAENLGVSYLAAQFLAKYQERSNQLSVMLQVNTHLNMAATKADYLEEITRFGKYFIQFDRAVLILHPEDTPEYFTVDHVDGDPTGLQVGMSYPVHNTLVSRCLKTGQTFIYRRDDGILEEGVYWAGDSEDYGFAQVVGFPLSRTKQAPGVLILESLEKVSVSDSEISIFEMISESLGAALTRFSLYERLANYATIDTLTHLYNLRALKQRFAEELARAGRYQNSLVVLFLDLDGFKSINDTYGHLMGDYVLRETAHIIRDTIRTSDIPGRYGGEEFVVIMVNADAESCMASAERICSAIRDFKFEMNEIRIQNKISIGLAEFPIDGESMEDLIQCADTAMYEAKARGGDQVVKYEKGMAKKLES